ncbi:mariner Mos1 transposase [Trichonephila clavipes]|nr:mariner Mos1 transposase [Trichonephila clavipes]
MLCIFWDQEGQIYYELLKPSETVNTDRYKQQLLNLNDAILEKREQYKKRHPKVIFLDDNAPSHHAKSTKDIVKALGCDMRLIPQTWFLPNITYLHHWDTHWRTNASLLSKTSNLGLMTGWPQKTNHFFAWYSQIARKMGGNVLLAMDIISNKEILTVSANLLCSFLKQSSHFICMHLVNIAVHSSAPFQMPPTAMVPSAPPPLLYLEN